MNLNEQLPTSGDTLRNLAEQAQKQLDLETMIDDAENVLKSLNDQRKMLSEVVIPRLMQDVGMSVLTLTNGAKVTVKPFYSGRVGGEKGYEWLLGNGHGAMVKAYIKVPFDFDSNNNAMLGLLETMDSTGLDYTIEKGVHHSTFGAWIKEQTEAGVPPPADLFSIYQGFKTSIK